MDTYTNLDTRIANYRYLDEANAKGIDLSKLADKCAKYEKEIEDHHKKIAELEKRTTPASAELFAIQEATVKDDTKVAEAYRTLDMLRKGALERLLRNDAEYKAADDQYRKVVNDVYLERAKRSAPEQMPKP